MRLLVVLSGLPGSGKTFFAHSLPPSPFRLLVEEDEVRERLCGTGRPFSMQGVWEEMAREATSFLSSKENAVVYLDAAHLLSRDRLAALEGVLHWDKAVLLWFSTPIEVCRARNAARPAERRVPDGVFAFMESSFEPPSKEEEKRFFFVYDYRQPAL